jgi:uncharacterized membrane protein
MPSSGGVPPWPPEPALERRMPKDRLTALTDGMIAIIITIMVLEMKVPHETGLAALARLWPVFFSYLLSFVYVAIYWNNHHHFFHLVPRITGRILWANLHLLFWLSLIPFATAWLGENSLSPLPAALYGATLLMCALAWYVMQRAIFSVQGRESALKKALGRDIKGKLSPLLYLLGIALAFVFPRLAVGLYAAVALIWLIPDRRIETAIAGARSNGR